MATPEFAKLRGAELRFAERRLASWTQRLGSSAGADETQHLRALNLTYIELARRWLGLAGPPMLGALVCLLLRTNIVVIVGGVTFGAVTVACLRAMALRWRQAHRFWPHRVDPRR